MNTPEERQKYVLTKLGEAYYTRMRNTGKALNAVKATEYLDKKGALKL